MEYRVRQAQLSDRSAILAFHRALYTKHRAAVMPEGMQLLYAYRDFESVLADDVDAMLRNPATAILVAEEIEGAPLGYVTGYVENDPRRVLSRKGIVGDWYVTEKLRGTGVGKRLLDALMAVFREAGCNLAEIATWPFNEGTRKVIDRLGFEEIQVVYRREL